jgi:hypothetical protein
MLRTSNQMRAVKAYEVINTEEAFHLAIQRHDVIGFIGTNTPYLDRAI